MYDYYKAVDCLSYFSQSLAITFHSHCSSINNPNLIMTDQDSMCQTIKIHCSKSSFRLLVHFISFLPCLGLDLTLTDSEIITNSKPLSSMIVTPLLLVNTIE